MTRAQASSGSGVFLVLMRSKLHDTGSEDGSGQRWHRYKQQAAVSEVAVVIKRELRLRAVRSGVVLGVLLTPSIVYAGLSIGWSFNMSVVTPLLGVGFWQGMALRVASHGACVKAISTRLPRRLWGQSSPTADDARRILSCAGEAPKIAWICLVGFLGIWIAGYLRPSLLDDPA